MPVQAPKRKFDKARVYGTIRIKAERVCCSTVGRSMVKRHWASAPKRAGYRAGGFEREVLPACVQLDIHGGKEVPEESQIKGVRPVS